MRPLIRSINPSPIKYSNQLSNIKKLTFHGTIGVELGIWMVSRFVVIIDDPPPIKPFFCSESWLLGIRRPFPSRCSLEYFWRSLIEKLDAIPVQLARNNAANSLMVSTFTLLSMYFDQEREWQRERVVATTVMSRAILGLKGVSPLIGMVANSRITSPSAFHLVFRSMWKLFLFVPMTWHRYEDLPLNIEQEPSEGK